MFLCFYRTAHLWTLFYLYFRPLLYIKADPLLNYCYKLLTLAFSFKIFVSTETCFNFDPELAPVSFWSTRVCVGVVLVRSLCRSLFDPVFASVSFWPGVCIGVVSTRSLHRCHFDLGFASVSFRSEVCIGVISVRSFDLTFY